MRPPFCKSSQRLHHSRCRREDIGRSPAGSENPLTRPPPLEPGFYGTVEAGDEAPLLWDFPRFYNWANGKTEIPENMAQYETFVTAYGTTLQLAAPSATE